MPYGSRFVSYFVAFPGEKEPLRRLLCRSRSRDDAAFSVALSVSLLVAWSAGRFAAVNSERKPLCRFIYRDDATLSPALLVALSLTSSLFLKR